MRIVDEGDRTIAFSKSEMRLIRMALAWVVDRLDADEIAVLSGVRDVSPVQVCEEFCRVDNVLNPPSVD